MTKILLMVSLLCLTQKTPALYGHACWSRELTIQLYEFEEVFKVLGAFGDHLGLLELNEKLLYDVCSRFTHLPENSV